MAEMIIKYLVLAVLILVPLYFGVWNESPFNLPKAIVLLVLTFAIFVTWFIKTILTERSLRS